MKFDELAKIGDWWSFSVQFKQCEISAKYASMRMLLFIFNGDTFCGNVIWKRSQPKRKCTTYYHVEKIYDIRHYFIIRRKYRKCIEICACCERKGGKFTVVNDIPLYRREGKLKMGGIESIWWPRGNFIVIWIYGNKRWRQLINQQCSDGIAAISR